MTSAEPRLALNSTRDLATFVESQPVLMTALTAVARLALPDGWIGAGLIRNAVWNALHGVPVRVHGGDVDVIYFEPANCDAAIDHAFEASLARINPNFQWSVKNQARMHQRNGDAPYKDSADALRHWSEICTAVAARLTPSGVEILAPFGCADLVSLRVRPTPAFRRKRSIYRQRIAAKRWAEQWPLLKIDDI